MKRPIAFAGATLGVALLSGLASALFLVSLAAVTRARLSHPGLLELLPLAGLVSVWLYRRFAPDAARGHNLILDEIHAEIQAEFGAETQKGLEGAAAVRIPPALGPLVLVTTLLTHAFGGSAGREGTAVQMGAASAERVGHWLGFEPRDRRTLLLVGMSAGFGSVFGTPWAGSVFGLETLAVGSLHWRRMLEADFWKRLLLCGLAAFGADWLTRQIGARAGFAHDAYSFGALPVWSIANLVLVAAAAIPFALASRGFVALLRGATRAFAWILKGPKDPYARIAVGGALVAGLAWWTGPAYLGLGTELTQGAFIAPASGWAPVGKAVFTALTLGSGFKGGEVTPLFFVGATLGSALSVFIPLSTGVLAALGFVAVFAGAANTPWTCVLMAMELFDPHIAPGAAVACLIAYFLSSHRGLYESQRVWRPKPRPRWKR